MLTNHPKDYSLIAPIYDLVFNNILSDGHQHLSKFLKSKRRISGHKILEVGVGSGLFLQHLPNNIEYTGIDINEKMLNLAKTKAVHYKNKKIKLQIMDAHKLHFKTNSFDLVMGASVITAVNDPHKVIREMIRITKKSGHLAIVANLRKKNSMASNLIKAFDPLTKNLLGFRTDFKSDAFDQYTELKVIEDKKVNHLFGFPLGNFMIFEKI